MTIDTIGGSLSRLIDRLIILIIRFRATFSRQIRLECISRQARSPLLTLCMIPVSVPVAFHHGGNEDTTSVFVLEATDVPSIATCGLDCGLWIALRYLCHQLRR